MSLAVSSVLELLDQLLLELEHVNKTRYIKLSKRSKIQTVGYPSKKKTHVLKTMDSGTQVHNQNNPT